MFIIYTDSVKRSSLVATTNYTSIIVNTILQSSNTTTLHYKCCLLKLKTQHSSAAFQRKGLQATSKYVYEVWSNYAHILGGYVPAMFPLCSLVLTKSKGLVAAAANAPESMPALNFYAKFDVLPSPQIACLIGPYSPNLMPKHAEKIQLVTKLAIVRQISYLKCNKYFCISSYVVSKVQIVTTCLKCVVELCK